MNIQRTAAAGLDKQIWVNGERSFTQTGEPDASFDLVTSQDSFLHAGQCDPLALHLGSRGGGVLMQVALSDEY